MTSRPLSVPPLRGVTALLGLVLTFCVSALCAFLLASGDMGVILGAHAEEARIVPGDGVVARIHTPYEGQLISGEVYDITVYMNGSELSTDDSDLEAGDTLAVTLPGQFSLDNVHYLYRSQTFGGEGEFSCVPLGEEVLCTVFGGEVALEDGELTLGGIRALQHVDASDTLTADLRLTRSQLRTSVLAEAAGARVELAWDAEDPGAVVDASVHTIPVLRSEQGALPAASEVALSTTEDVVADVKEVRWIQLSGYEALYLLDEAGVRPVPKAHVELVQGEPELVDSAFFLEYPMGSAMSMEELQVLASE